MPREESLKGRSASLRVRWKNKWSHQWVVAPAGFGRDAGGGWDVRHVAESGTVFPRVSRDTTLRSVLSRLLGLCYKAEYLRLRPQLVYCRPTSLAHYSEVRSSGHY